MRAHTQAQQHYHYFFLFCSLFYRLYFPQLVCEKSNAARERAVQPLESEFDVQFLNKLIVSRLYTVFSILCWYPFKLQVCSCRLTERKSHVNFEPQLSCVLCVGVFFKESASVLKIHFKSATYVIRVVCFSIVQISARIFRVSLIPANTLRKFNFFG